MFCGGIFPIAQHAIRPFLHSTNPQHGCCMCQGEVDERIDLWVDDVRAFLHRGCLPEFLATTEGRAILDSGHTVLVPAVGREAQRETRHL